MSKEIAKQKSHNKSDFIAQIAKKIKVTSKEADRLVNAVLDTLQETLAKGIDQTFIGFGAFIVKDRPEKMGRNHSTGKSITIQARCVPKRLIALLVSCCLGTIAYADPSLNLNKNNSNAVSKRLQFEGKQNSNPFSITAYEPNYILPFNYSSSPSPIYNDSTPDGQKIQPVDVKFQLSLKSPIWQNFFGKKNALYLAYTQKSFWQAYNDSPFFRDNSYQPEIFLENNIDFPLLAGWKMQLINFGAMHQSNGRGGELERSWNRIYIDANFSKGAWLVSIRPWYVVKDDTFEKHNSDIEHYLGHGRLLIAYKAGQQVISLETYNNFESGFQRGSGQVSYSFPLVKKIRGFFQVSTGYGQTLLEYNHRTNSVGFGISLSDWL